MCHPDVFPLRIVAWLWLMCMSVSRCMGEALPHPKGCHSWLCRIKNPLLLAAG